MWRPLRDVFVRPHYGALALTVSFIVFTFAVWLPNTRLIVDVISSGDIALGAKAQLLFSLYGSIATNFTLVSAVYTIAIAVLFGINVALLTYYIKALRGGFSKENTTTGTLGLISGFFGIGCAACGTFILSSVLGLFGAAGIVTFLPLGGEEFGILGVILLGYTTIAISRKIGGPLVCEI